MCSATRTRYWSGLIGLCIPVRAPSELSRVPGRERERALSRLATDKSPSKAKLADVKIVAAMNRAIDLRGFRVEASMALEVGNRSSYESGDESADQSSIRVCGLFV